MRVKSLETGKFIEVCDRCGVELSYKERLEGRVCAVCKRIAQDKEDEYKRQHNGLERP